MIGADVEGDIGRWLQGLEEGANFAGTAGAEFHDHPIAEGVSDGCRLVLQQGDLGASESVFRLFTDLVKES